MEKSIAITEEQRRQFDEDGFILIEDALSSTEVGDVNRSGGRVRWAVSERGKGSGLTNRFRSGMPSPTMRSCVASNRSSGAAARLW